MTPVLEELVKYGQEIGQRAHEGCELSKRVVDLYQLVYRRYESVSLGLLEAAFQEWKAKYHPE